MHRALLAVLLLATAPPAHADGGAFCEVTPCVPGPVTRRKLTKHEKVHGVVCKKGEELGVDSQKRVVFCTTAAIANVDGLPVAAKAYTLFHPSGRIYQTHIRAKVERVLADQSKVTCGVGLIVIASDGTLAYCELAARAGSPRGKPGEGISFHPSGRLHGLTLDEPYQAGKVALSAGASVLWDDKGNVLGGYTPSPIKVGALSIRSDFELHGNGALEIVELADPAKIQGHDFPAWAKLELRVDGTLVRAEYVSDRGFMIHGEEWTDTTHVTYDGKGKVTSTYVDHWQSDVRPPKFRP